MKKIKLFVAVVILVALFRWSALFILIGLLPAIMSRVTDRSHGKTYSKIVLCFNTAGILPFAADLWNAGNSWGAVSSTLTNMNALLAVYGAAAIGWGLIMFMPSLVILIISGTNDAKVEEVMQEQAKLLEEWGTQLKQYE